MQQDRCYKSAFCYYFDASIVVIMGIGRICFIYSYFRQMSLCSSTWFIVNIIWLIALTLMNSSFSVLNSTFLCFYVLLHWVFVISAIELPIVLNVAIIQPILPLHSIPLQQTEDLMVFYCTLYILSLVVSYSENSELLIIAFLFIYFWDNLWNAIL